MAASAIKVLERVGVSDRSSHDAVQNALSEASKTVRGIRGLDVVQTTAKVEDDEIVEYHANAKFAFPVERWIHRRMRRTLTLALALTLLAVAVWPDTARSEGELVVVDRFRLNPATVSIPVGASVTFRMERDESLVEPMQPLTLVADDGSFRSPPLEPGERWHFRFERAGLYRYHIEQHPDVEGTIVVE